MIVFIVSLTLFVNFALCFFIPPLLTPVLVAIAMVSGDICGKFIDDYFRRSKESENESLFHKERD